ncbi:MAG TPA: glycosyltransferase family 2 protein [Rhodanobacteraceae bacterium]|nr:glycosyltransferase family 2 protein [Rhodanobacteraceae bacterium]
MKLIIMIPCLNEEGTLPLVLGSIPKHIDGVDCIELLIIDDGCTDRTVEVARRLGVRHFVHHRKNQGLSRSFRDGLVRALELGADIIVLTDGDNQYKQERIPELIRPILDGKADTVIADRDTQSIEHFSPAKKFLQRLGTWVLNLAAGTGVPDATSGFRAYSRKAAMQLNIIAEYSFATETTIQAAHKHHALSYVAIPTNEKLRESRQFKSNWQHVRRSAVTIVRAFIMYKPYAVFLSLGFAFLLLGLAPFVHVLWKALTVREYLIFGPQHIRSLVVGTVLLIAAFISFTLGIVADLVRINRLLLEDVLEQVKLARLQQSGDSVTAPAAANGRDEMAGSGDCVQP